VPLAGSSALSNAAVLGSSTVPSAPLASICGVVMSALNAVGVPVVAPST